MVETGDQLVTLMRAPNEFAAGLIVAALDEEGIEAFSFGTAQAGLGLPLHPGGGDSVLVQVRSRDRSSAHDLLVSLKETMADFDWDHVDVGERLDALPLTPTGGMPWLAVVGVVVGTLLIVILLIAAVAMTF